MDDNPARLYLDLPENALQRLRGTIDAGLKQTATDRSVPVFFRADDIGVMSSTFARLMDLFSQHRMPLCLAVVPTWLSRSRWSTFSNYWETSSPLWCWHQHGWRHANHETTGKKSEFGNTRSSEALKHDLANGRDHLRRIIGERYSPFFTPPWNRCSELTISLLQELGVHGISRSSGEQNGAASLPDYYINVDLHTRKEPSAELCLEALSEEMKRAVASGCVGIMIHHQRMNDLAFTLLDGLLGLISDNHALIPNNFNNLHSNP